MYDVGEPYEYDETQLLSGDRKFAKVTVQMHGSREKWYTVIKAKRPSSWRFALPGAGVRNISSFVTLILTLAS